MNTDTPHNSKPIERRSRAHTIMLAVIAVLAATTIVQGLALIRMRSENGMLVNQTWCNRLRNLLAGKTSMTHKTPAPDHNNQVIVWKANDDLDYIHNRINHVLRNMHLRFGLNPAPLRLSETSANDHPNANRRIFSGQTPRPNDLTLLRREIDRIFAEAYRDFQSQNLPERVHQGWDTVHASTAMNIEDQGQGYLVTVALPGYSKDQITVAIEGRLLKITAHTSDCSNYNGAISAQIVLPHDIERESAHAEYSGNLLRIQIPRQAETNLLVRHVAIR